MARRIADQVIDSINQNIKSVSDFCRQLNEPVNEIRGQFDGGADEGMAYIKDNLNHIDGELSYVKIVEGPSGEIKKRIETVTLSQAAADVFSDVGFWLHVEHGMGTGDDLINGEIIWIICPDKHKFSFKFCYYIDCELYFDLEDFYGGRKVRQGAEAEIELDLDFCSGDIAKFKRLMKGFNLQDIEFKVSVSDRSRDVSLEINIDSYMFQNKKIASFMRSNEQIYVWQYDLSPQKLVEKWKKEDRFPNNHIMIQALDLIDKIGDPPKLSSGILELRLIIGDEQAHMVARAPMGWAVRSEIQEGWLRFPSFEEYDSVEFEFVS